MGLNVTSSDSVTSNEYKTKEITLFEIMLFQMFKEKESDYDGVGRVLLKLKLEQESNGKDSKENE